MGVASVCYAADAFKPENHPASIGARGAEPRRGEGIIEVCYVGFDCKYFRKTKHQFASKIYLLHGAVTYCT